jgi:predicted lipoprotein with Yx(FWY)xxD motif
VTRTRSIVAFAAVTLALAACASDSSTTVSAGGTTSTSTSTSSGASDGATVSTARAGDLGTVLVDANGMTLYLFQNDTGTTSTCTGSCAGTWPALTTKDSATAGGGADDSKLGTTMRDDGTTQVTYAGHPVYLYSGDSAAGDTNGQGIGGVWFAVTADGTPAAAGGGTSTSSSGGGYGSYP